TGFFFGHPSECRQYYADSGYIRNYDVCAVVEGCRDGRIYCIQRNKFKVGDELEILAPGSTGIPMTAEDIRDADDMPMEDTRFAARPFSMVNTTGQVFEKGSLIRKKV
ncbi:MAG: U32 family peptidase C-terminal domain-containing protein, partial [Oscillospiraceae bacterium]|nr:U32 family peptidase C-terminal domain-containing protein [Oscillospiraceae bacterium]